MQARIVQLQEKWLVAKRMRMSFARDQTPQLWRSFMPQRKNIPGVLGPDLYSVQLYPEHFFEHFQPELTFEKWAGVEVPGGSTALPEDMELVLLPAGLYAVFDYKGSSTDHSIFTYIFKEWLPAQPEYRLDQRPHFEVLGDKYKNGDPESEEEIWIPIKYRDKE